MVNDNQDSKDFSRRKFLKGGVLLGAAVGLSTLSDKKVSTEVAKAIGKKELDSFPHEVKPDYKRFPEARIIDYRVMNGDKEYLARLEGLPGLFGIVDDNKPGYTSLDMAFNMSAWSSEYDFGRLVYDWNFKKPSEFKKQFTSKEEASKAVKKATKFYGADLVGITAYDNKWVYDPCISLVDGSELNEKDMPFKPKSVIVMAVEMDYEAIGLTPSVLSNVAVGMGYSAMVEVSNKVSAFINNLGYGAFAAGNNTAMSVPYAIAAGLGEQGRQGLLLTYEYGPRVRLTKVFTEMELAYDKPIKFGASEFCKVCKKCAETCPSKSVPFGDEMTWEGDGFKIISNLEGVKKYYVNVETCFIYWNTVGCGCDCCVTSCPYNKPGFWHHRITTMLTGTPLKPFLNEMDDLFGYGDVFDEQGCIDFWDLDNYLK